MRSLPDCNALVPAIQVCTLSNVHYARRPFACPDSPGSDLGLLWMKKNTHTDAHAHVRLDLTCVASQHPSRPSRTQVSTARPSSWCPLPPSALIRCPAAASLQRYSCRDAAARRVAAAAAASLHECAYSAMHDSMRTCILATQRTCAAVACFCTRARTRSVNILESPARAKTRHAHAHPTAHSLAA